MDGVRGVVSWGGEVREACVGERGAVRAWAAACRGRGGILESVTVDGVAAWDVLLAEPVLEPVRAAPEPVEEAICGEACELFVVVGNGWIAVQVDGGVPDTERWRRIIWPAVLAAREADRVAAAKRRRTLEAKAAEREA